LSCWEEVKCLGSHSQHFVIGVSGCLRFSDNMLTFRGHSIAQNSVILASCQSPFCSDLSP
jgi:hypothetical protein